ncbi:MAG: hypothetical protein V3T28_07660 [Gemmatimonadales bacterium]
MTRPLLRTLVVGAVLMPLLIFPKAGAAQFRESPPPPAYALRNVTVIHADGRREAGVNLVVRGGLIASWGPDVEIPGDARVLEGDSLFVYPGLVDAQGKAEVEFPEIERSDSVRSWDGPRNLQGFLAHRRVADYLTHTGADGKEQRAAGIVAAGIHADGALAAGLGIAILYRTDVDRPWELIANDNIGLAMAFQSGKGVYPGTLFGIIAFMRQAFEDAARDGMIREAYARSPEGLGVPSVDPDYTVLRRVMAGEIPVYFTANRAEDIRRVLALSDEYGFRPVIVGGHEAWRVAGELARRDITVLIDGDFPERDKWKVEEEPESGEAEEEEAEPDSAQAEAARAEQAEVAEPEELEPAAAREQKRLEDIWSNAGRLEAARVTFAITTGGGDADLREAARKAIEYGLTEAAALRALTITPAALLGIPHVPRLEEGLAATFVALTGPLFDEDSEVKYTFVEGNYEEGAAGGAGGDAPAVVVTGDWTIKMEASGQEFIFEASLDMKPDGSFRGTARNDQVGSATIRGKVSGNDISFTLSINAGGQQFELSAEGTVEADRMSGSGESPFGSFTFSGRKTPGGVR